RRRGPYQPGAPAPGIRVPQEPRAEGPFQPRATSTTWGGPLALERCGRWFLGLAPQAGMWSGLWPSGSRRRNVVAPTKRSDVRPIADIKPARRNVDRDVAAVAVPRPLR